MKRSWIFGTLAAVVLLTTLLTFTSKGHNLIDVDKRPVEEKDALTASQEEEPTLDENNDFACNLFRTICEQKKGMGSVIVSPISVGYLLGMLHEGAGGETRRQITDVLGLGGSAQEINEYFKKMMDEAPNLDPKVTVKTANCIYFKSSDQIIPQYKADMQNYYDAQIEAIDFNSSNIVHKINNWCNIHTHGMIPEIISEGELNPNRVMYLLNAVYFKASWTTKFDSKETRDNYFTKQDGTTVQHRMMHLQTKAAYGEDDLCKMLCLPYGNRAYSMIVLLPRKGKTINDIVQSLSAQKLEEMRKRKMSSRKVDILLPPFTTESQTGLIGVLSAMGMPRAFGMSAEFPNMLQGHDNDLFVSMMKQKARIEVNEKGTKAAAVTVAEMSVKSAVVVEEPLYLFHATRPFVYCIVENKTGTIFFMGTYCGENGGKKVEGRNPDKDDETVLVLDQGNVKEREKIDDPDEIFRSVEQMPRYPGGEAALMKYIESHINYPSMAAMNNVQGRVIVQFVVERTGSVGEVKVVRSVDKDLDREAVRLVKTLPEFEPGRQNGKVVRVWYTLPVTFKLPQENKIN